MSKKLIVLYFTDDVLVVAVGGFYSNAGACESFPAKSESALLPESALKISNVVTIPQTLP